VKPAPAAPWGATEPISGLAIEPEPVAERAGIGLCLSGGGYRAMLFHLGALWRLNEVGYLPRLDRISSVSGGSITAGVLAMAWQRLEFNGFVAGNFEAEAVRPIRRLAGRTIDVPSVLLGWLGRGPAFHYRKHLFGGRTLQDLPSRPTFVINASNVQSCALVRFTKAYLWDWRVGKVPRPGIRMADAVAASAAFPPVLSPFRLRLDPGSFAPDTGDGLQRPPFTRTMVLTDGGVYDNLGLETVWKRCQTVLVSDGGVRPREQERPAGNWIGHLARVIPMIHNQVSSVRRRLLIDSYVTKDPRAHREGTYWGVGSRYQDYPAAPPLDCPHDRTLRLAAVPTRLCRVPDLLQRRLINWGYAACAAGMRSHVPDAEDAPAAFPYPDAGVGD
jgi:NTE family protein